MVNSAEPRSVPSARRSSSLGGGGRVGHLRPGQQAVVHGGGRVLDRLPLGRRGRQRRDGQDRDVHDRGPEQRPHRSGHHPDAGPGVARAPAGSTPAPVTVKFSASDPSTGGPAAEERRRRGLGRQAGSRTRRRSTRVTRSRWNFPSETAVFPHDVWVIAPGGDAASATQVTSGLKFPGDAPVSQDVHAERHVEVRLQDPLVAHGRRLRPAWSAPRSSRPLRPATRRPASTTPSTASRRARPRATGSRPTNTGGANPFASQVTVSAEGQHTVEFRSVDKAGNVETAKSVAFGIDIPEPGTPVIEAFADPATGAAPLETRFSASGLRSRRRRAVYKWEFADGAFIGRAVTRTYTKPGTYIGKVTATDDEGDKTVKEVTVTVTAPGVQPPTVEAGSSVTSGPARLSGRVQRHWHRPGWAGRPADVQVGVRRRRPRRSSRTRPTPTARRARTPRRSRSSDGTGATATKTITITVTDPPGNQAPIDRVHGSAARTGDALSVQFTAGPPTRRTRPLTYAWDFDDGSAKGAGDDVTHTYTSAGTYSVKLTPRTRTGPRPSSRSTVTVTATANQAPTVEVAADPASGHRAADGAVQLAGQAIRERQPALRLERSATAVARPSRPRATPTPRPGTYTATLKVTDEKGASTTATIQITVTAAQAAPQAAAKAPDVAPAAPAVNPWFGVGKPAKTTRRRRSPRAAWRSGHVHRGDDRHGHAHASRAKVPSSSA